MTIEKIVARISGLGGPVSRIINKTMELARVGMVPEDECVRLPKVEEWPEDVLKGKPAAIFVAYSWHETAKKQELYHGVPLLAWIPRPAPAWTPKVGDRVFVHFIPVRVGVIKSIPSKGDPYYQVLVNGELEQVFKIEIMKLFADEHIGKPWEEIPNA